MPKARRRRRCPREPGAVAGGAEHSASVGPSSRQRQFAAAERSTAGEQRLGRRQGVRGDAAVAPEGGPRRPAGRGPATAGRPAQVADAVGAQGVEHVDDHQARWGARPGADSRDPSGPSPRTEPQPAPAARRSAPFGAQAHAHEAGLRPERQLDAERARQERARRAASPGGCDLARLALQDQLEALPVARRRRRPEGPGEGLAAGDRADQVDDGVARCTMSAPPTRRPPLASASRRRLRRPAPPRPRGHRPREVERDAADRQVGRQRHLERIGEREGAEVAGTVAEAEEARGGQRGEIDGQPPRPRRELHQLQPRAGRGGDQPKRAVRDLRRPAGQKAVAVAGRWPREAPLLDQQVGGVGVVEEGAQDRLGPAAPARREGDERQGGQRDRSTEVPTAHDLRCYEHRAHPSRARRLRSAPRPDDRMPQGTVGGIETTIANGCCPVVPTDCTTIRHWPTAGAFTTTCSTVLRLSE